MYNFYDIDGDNVDNKSIKMHALSESSKVMKDGGKLAIVRDGGDSLPYKKYMKESGFEFETEKNVRGYNQKIVIGRKGHDK